MPGGRGLRVARDERRELLAEGREPPKSGLLFWALFCSGSGRDWPWPWALLEPTSGDYGKKQSPKVGERSCWSW